MQVVLIVVLVIVNLPIAFAIGWCFFSTWSGLAETLYFAVSPLWQWVFFDEENQVFYSQVKVAAYVVTCAAVLYVEYLGLHAIGWL